MRVVISGRVGQYVSVLVTRQEKCITGSCYEMRREERKRCHEMIILIEKVIRERYVQTNTTVCGDYREVRTD